MIPFFPRIFRVLLAEADAKFETECESCRALLEKNNMTNGSLSEAVANLHAKVKFDLEKARREKDLKVLKRKQWSMVTDSSKSAKVGEKPEQSVKSETGVKEEVLDSEEEGKVDQLVEAAIDAPNDDDLPAPSQDSVSTLENWGDANLPKEELARSGRVIFSLLVIVVAFVCFCVFSLFWGTGQHVSICVLDKM